MKTKLFTLLLITVCISMTSAIAAGHNKNVINYDNNNQSEIVSEDQNSQILSLFERLNVPRLSDFPEFQDLVFVPAEDYDFEADFYGNMEHNEEILNNNSKDNNNNIKNNRK